MILKLTQFISSIGFSVCHQIPQRTFLFGKIYMPVCSRCSGMYIGFLISIIFLFLVFRKRESDLPPVYIIIISIAFILSTIIDGGLSYFRVYSTNNTIRLITGYLFGAGIAIMVYPVFIYQFYKSSQKKKIFHDFKHFIYFMLISLFFMLILLSSLPVLGNFFYYLNGVAVVFAFYFTNLTLILLIPFFAQKASRLLSRHMLMPSLIALVSTVLELFAAFKLHSLIS